MRSFDGSLDKRPGITILTSSSDEGVATVEALVTASQDNGILNADVDLVVSNHEDSRAFEKIRELNDRYSLRIRTEHISQHTHPGGASRNTAEQTDSESEAIFDLAEEIAFGKISVVLLAGYLRKVRGSLMTHCGSSWASERIEFSKLYNNHLGSLPSTAGHHGIGVYRRVAELGMSRSAQVLQGVTPDHYNKGPIYKTNYFEVPVVPADATEEEKEETVKQIKAITLAKNAVFLPRDLNSLINARRAHLKELSY